MVETSGEGAVVKVFRKLSSHSGKDLCIAISKHSCYAPDGYKMDTLRKCLHPFDTGAESHLTLQRMQGFLSSHNKGNQERFLQVCACNSCLEE